MIDMKILQSALYLSWIPKLITKSTDKWKVFPKIYYSQLGEGLSILHTPCVLKDLMGYPRKEGEFWKKCIGQLDPSQAVSLGRYKAIELKFSTMEQ